MTGDLLVLLALTLGAVALVTVVAWVIGVAIDRRDQAWQRRNPGRSRISAAAPTVEYEPSPEHPTHRDWKGPDGNR